MSYPRPDEEAAEARIERERKAKSTAKNLALGLGSAAVGAAGLGMSAKILPFLNEFIPPDLAMKAISKVSPKFGEFLKKGQSMGLDVKEGLNFLKEKMSPTQQQEQPQENANVIQQYSPELYEFIENHIQKGRAPLEAGALAQLDPKFKKAIEQMQKDHKTPFSAILQAIYGQDQTQQKSPQMNQQQAQPEQMQQMQQQPGQGQAALMAILQKIQQSRGAQ